MEQKRKPGRPLSENAKRIRALKVKEIASFPFPTKDPADRYRFYGNIADMARKTGRVLARSFTPIPGESEVLVVRQA